MGRYTGREPDMNRRKFLAFLGMSPVAVPMAAQATATGTLRLPLSARFKVYRQMVLKGLMSRDDVRRLEDLPTQFEAILPLQRDAAISGVTTIRAQMTDESMSFLRDVQESVQRAESVLEKTNLSWLSERSKTVDGVEFVNGYPSPMGDDADTEAKSIVAEGAAESAATGSMRNQA